RLGRLPRAQRCAAPLSARLPCPTPSHYGLACRHLLRPSSGGVRDALGAVPPPPVRDRLGVILMAAAGEYPIPADGPCPHRWIVPGAATPATRRRRDIRALAQALDDVAFDSRPPLPDHARSHGVALVLAVAVPTTPPPLGFLLGGFTALVLGLALLSRTRPPGLVVPSPMATRRAIGFALVFALTAACFSRIWRSALDGIDHSLWLLALGDVLFVTLGLFAWFLVLVEDIPTRVLGLHWSGGRRALWAWLLCIAMPIVASLPHYLDLWNGRKPFSMDACVFGALYAAGAASVPQEILFRRYP